MQGYLDRFVRWWSGLVLHRDALTNAGYAPIREVSDVPVIFLSVNGQEEIIARAFEMGADDYVVKPFSPTELVARIKAALRKREALRMGRAVGTLRVWRADHRLRRAPRDAGRASRAADRHRVRPRWRQGEWRLAQFEERMCG